MKESIISTMRKLAKESQASTHREAESPLESGMKVVIKRSLEDIIFKGECLRRECDGGAIITII